MKGFSVWPQNPLGNCVFLSVHFPKEVGIWFLIKSQKQGEEVRKSFESFVSDGATNKTPHKIQLQLLHFPNTAKEKRMEEE